MRLKGQVGARDFTIKMKDWEIQRKNDENAKLRAELEALKNPPQAA
jgi:hypothetical protein